jgi:energy-coupling factor transporter ATP-binding protein EcfA2
MQILSLTIYRADGKSRTIDFKPGELNIITGDSRTGKSSLINIFRYCLGSDSPHAPHGPIRDLVAWYGLVAQVGSTEFFVGRPAPRENAGTSAAMLVIGVNQPLPFERLDDDTTSSAVRQYIGGLLGIEDNANVPPPGQTRQQLTANLVHSLYYCFQGQGEIANPDILFHRQNRDWQPRTIKDTLPYFLGAIGLDDLRKRRELTDRRRALRRLQQQFQAAQAERELGLGRASSLLAEARDAGMMSVPNPKDLASALVVLAQIAAGTVQAPVSSIDEFERLANERRQSRDRIRGLKSQLYGLDDFAEVANGYARELSEQRARLSSIGLIPQPLDTSVSCAMCSQPLGTTGSTAFEQVQSIFGRIERRLASSRRDTPRIEGARTGILDQLEAERDRLAQLDEDIDSLTETDEAISRLRTTLDVRSYIQGRISQYLDQTEIADDDAIGALELSLKKLSEQVGVLESELDADTLRSKVASLLAGVSRRMTEWAQGLDLEHAEHGVRIDIDKLTIVADTPEGPAYMDRGEIGSGRNWVGYHLTAYLALQDFFISRNRPVPSFIVLDQLSQAFFPRDRQIGGDLDELSDSDRENTRELYEFLYRIVTELDGDLQIIALDHAEFDDDWFQRSISERWRGGQALIPLDWITE